MKELFRADRFQAVDGDSGSERAEGVERESHGGVIDLPDDFPGIPVIADVTGPGQRLESHAQSARGGAHSELAEIIDNTGTIRERMRRHIGADQHEIGAEHFEDIEFALRTIEHAFTHGRRHSFKVAKRLECDAGESLVAHHGADHVHRFRRREQVALEYLDVLEAGVGDGAQLGAQRAVDGNRGDGSQQGDSPRLSSTPMPSGSRKSSC